MGDNPAPSAESDARTRVRCEGTGTPAKNVTRAWIGRLLPVVGDCQTCGQQIRVTREWAVKYHTAYVTTPASPKGVSDE